MKRMHILLGMMAASMLLSACNKSTGSSVHTSDSAVTSWSVNDDFSETSLPEDAQKALESAVASDNNNSVPVELIGRQIVSGTNYAILCYTDDSNQLEVDTIYQPLDGSDASILNRVPLQYDAFITNDKSNPFDSDDLQLTGAFYTDHSDFTFQKDSFITDKKLEASLQKYVSDEYSKDIDVKPAAVLWNGKNKQDETVSKAVLCLLSDQDDQAYWSVAVVDVENDSYPVSSMHILDLNTYAGMKEEG